MIQYRQIEFSEAMEMIAIDDLENLYFETQDGSIDCIESYRLGMTGLKKKKYFIREVVK